MCDNPNDYKPTEMSLSEDLEQLIWLQKGIPVGVVMTCNHCPSINTQEDYDNFVLEKTRGPGVWE
jgi:CMP-2-keto-3-deoxyoctulosonic acid synthetase